MTDTPELTPSSEPAQATAGQLLRQARLCAGTHLAILSAALKVPVKTLELLEADQHESLGAPAFVRALAGSVCRHLHTDPQPILARLPQTASLLKPAPVALDTENRRKPGSRSWSGLRWREPLLWLGALMLALTVILIWWPQLLHNPLASVSPSGAEQMPAQEASASPLPMEPASAVAMGQPTEVMQAPLAAGPGSTPAIQAVVTPAPSPVSSVSSIDVASASAPAPEGKALMAVSARSDSWVEVRDAAGMVLLSKLMKAGERETIANAQTLRVVIGRADAVQVEVKGKAFDLKPHTQVTVARFEVQP